MTMMLLGHEKQIRVVIVMIVQCLLLANTVQSFQSIHTTSKNSLVTKIPTFPLYSSSSSNNKDEEIARLEEQLRKLKEEQGIDSDDGTISSPPTQAEEGGEVESPVAEEVPLELFLSEKWKEGEVSNGNDGEDGDGGGGIGGAATGILGAVGLAIFLAFFSQVPIGQEDLSKYSAIKAPTEQIDLGDLNRARNSGDI